MQTTKYLSVLGTDLPQPVCFYVIERLTANYTFGFICSIGIPMWYPAVQITLLFLPHCNYIL